MDLREITDFNAPELDVYARLTENQLVNRADPANALFIAESPLVIGRALDAGCVPVSFLMERKHVEGKAAELLARCPADIPVYAAPLEVLEQLTGFKLTRGMLCAMRRPKLPTVEQVCAGARRVAVLENVMNPTNIGAIFRSAAALNMDAMLLSSQGSDPLYRRAVRVSMGTVFQIPWTYFPEEAAWSEGGSWASRPPPWRCGTILCPSTIPACSRTRSWPWCWGRRGTAWPPKPSPTATIRCASPWPTGWTA